MKITIMLYEQMTALDVMGPYEVLSRLPEAEVTFVAKKKGLVKNDIGSLGIEAHKSIDEVDSTDIFLVGGGPGDPAVREDAEQLEWVRKMDKTSQWTTSVCTGSLILAAAGLLEGRNATSHFAFLDVLEAFGAKKTLQRTVFDGKVVTAAGVSAGIDMALALTAKIVDENYAKAIQLGIEYDPQPPFDSGSPTKAAPEVVELVAGLMGAA